MGIQDSAKFVITEMHNDSNVQRIPSRLAD